MTMSIKPVIEFTLEGRDWIRSISYKHSIKVSGESAFDECGRFRSGMFYIDWGVVLVEINVRMEMLLDGALLQVVDEFVKVLNEHAIVPC